MSINEADRSYPDKIPGKISYLCSMVQQVVIALIFGAALYYLGRMAYRSFQAKKACDSGCGKCGAVDFEKIEKQLQQRKLD